MISIPQRYGKIIHQMMANSQGQHVITEENVWQEGNATNRNLFYGIIEDLLLPGSAVVGIEHLVELHQKASEGKACLILCEHYSNFDLPALIYLTEKTHGQPDVANSVFAIAGFKLNEESPAVLAFTEAFNRIVIYPSRSIEALPDGPEKEEELKLARRINLASMKALSQAKTTGKVVLLYPAGTRYRPGKPETKKGVKEVDSYIKGFDHMVLVSINGNTLHVSDDGSMIEDQAHRDVVLYGVSPVLDCAEFRKAAQEKCPEGEDSKQFTVDQVMAKLDELHAQNEPARAKRLAELPPQAD